MQTSGATQSDGDHEDRLTEIEVITQSLMKRYADHFTLEWRDDVSDFDDGDIPTPTGGGAFLPSPTHEPPCLYMTREDAVGAGGPGPWIFISYREERMPGDMFQDVVTPNQLADAIISDDPLHDPEMTEWAVRKGWKG